MQQTQTKILFISHAASRSGAPFVLLYLMQWLKANSNYQFDVLLLQDGPLKEEFSRVAGNVYVLPQLMGQHSVRLKVLRRLKLLPPDDRRMKKVLGGIDIKGYDIVYGNTVLSLPLLRTIQKLTAAKSIIAIHELTTSIETFYARAYISAELPKLDYVIAGSQAVADNLQQRYQIPASIIQVVHAFIHTYNLPKKGRSILETAGVPVNRFVIGGAGTPEWRKGMDLIVPLGMYLQKHFPELDFHIVWVGGQKTDHFIRYMQVDIEKSGLQDRITLVENTKEYLEYIGAYDVFAMLSREDPFPLVSIEAAYLQKPIVMFAGTGGTEEILQTGGGVAVPYMDIERLAKAIVKLAGDSALRLQMGKQLHTEVVSHYSSEVACKKVAAILQMLAPQA